MKYFCTGKRKFEEIATIDHPYSVRTPKTMKRRWTQVLSKVIHKNKLIKNIKQRKTRQERKMKSIITDLSNQNMLSKESHQKLENYQDLPISLILGKQGRGYSNQQKHFATTLYYYSPVAYKYLRKRFRLPSPRIISKWLQSIDGSPGLTKQSFDLIKAKTQSEESAWTHKLCCLHIDEMDIKKYLEYDKITRRVYGYVDIGTGLQSQFLKI